MSDVATRVVEAFVGEHGAGKSELALSRALWLARNGVKVSLADLDTVEPCYTLSSRLAKSLTTIPNLKVLTSASMRSFPGEAGNILAPQVRWVLRTAENAILDIGYGVDGYKVLLLLEDYKEMAERIKINFVVNFSRPTTSTIEGALESMSLYRRVDAIINNTHLGDETTLDVIMKGEELALQLAMRTKVPLLASAIWHKLADTFLAQPEHQGASHKDIKTNSRAQDKAGTQFPGPKETPDEQASPLNKKSLQGQHQYTQDEGTSIKKYAELAGAKLEPFSASAEVEVDVNEALKVVEMCQNRIHPQLRKLFRKDIWLIARLIPYGFWE